MQPSISLPQILHFLCPRPASLAGVCGARTALRPHPGVGDKERIAGTQPSGGMGAGQAPGAGRSSGRNTGSAGKISGFGEKTKEERKWGCPTPFLLPYVSLLMTCLLSEHRIRPSGTPTPAEERRERGPSFSIHWGWNCNQRPADRGDSRTSAPLHPGHTL